MVGRRFFFLPQDDEHATGSLGILTRTYQVLPLCIRNLSAFRTHRRKQVPLLRAGVEEGDVCVPRIRHSSKQNKNTYKKNPTERGSFCELVSKKEVTRWRNGTAKNSKIVLRASVIPEFFFIIHHFGSYCGGIRTFFLIFSTASNKRLNSSSVSPSGFSVARIT